jgi:hypothetical protein
MKKKQWGSVKEYANALLLRKVNEDEDGRSVGHTYRQILTRLRQRFPVIEYSGPHKGNPIRMTIKQLREIAYTMQSNDRTLRLPVRPRSDRKKKKLASIAATSPKKVASVSAATTARRKG